MSNGTNEHSKLKSRLQSFITNASKSKSVDDMKYARGQIRANFGLGKLDEKSFQKLEGSTTKFIDSNGKDDPFAGSSLGTVVGIAVFVFVVWSMVLPHYQEGKIQTEQARTTETAPESHYIPNERFIEPIMSNEKRTRRRADTKQNTRRNRRDHGFKTASTRIVNQRPM